jgi:rhodanese-related sulfurtransferase
MDAEKMALSSNQNPQQNSSNGIAKATYLVQYPTSHHCRCVVCKNSTGGKQNMKNIISIVRRIAVGALFAVSAQAALAVEETPNTIPGGTMVSTDQAKQQFDKGAKFIDNRVAAEYAEKHIKGAINVVFKEKFGKESKLDPEDSFDLAKLPADKATAMVFYCNGSPCWKGYKGAAAAIKAGYKNVFWYRDGLPGWTAKALPTE